MKKILIINASARTDLSKSRMLTSAFAEQWGSRLGDDHITYRYLSIDYIPHVDEQWAVAAGNQKAAETNRYRY